MLCNLHLQLWRNIFRLRNWKHIAFGYDAFETSFISMSFDINCSIETRPAAYSISWNEWGQRQSYWQRFCLFDIMQHSFVSEKWKLGDQSNHLWKMHICLKSINRPPPFQFNKAFSIRIRFPCQFPNSYIQIVLCLRDGLWQNVTLFWLLNSRSSA